MIDPPVGDPATPDDDGASFSGVEKHSLVIAGHRTSISLEAAFWHALKDIARDQGVSLAALVSEVDSRRGAANLSSALRVFVLAETQAKATMTPPR
ncbi:ribbon-helix-helix domain-containing protein [Roseiarcaceae bacterium H3SJ34-1]|uniref:ribbon-helix-helix domain-containing protein n=1 Tax=Terripilifer ovatus TaxID=3032367 RepID=UPI003AB92264|nr:ribbon-helix-helix domain-containing protein [Roseiarcaceae bacterium H3SJ34-1]